jgi:uncharacterized protein (TIGR03118 family)
MNKQYLLCGFLVSVAASAWAVACSDAAGDAPAGYVDGSAPDSALQSPPAGDADAPDGTAVDASATVFRVTRADLVVDMGGANADPKLVNPWGLAFNPAGPIWVADNHTGFATVYDATGAALPLVVTVPAPPGAAGPSAPTGQVFNASADFMGDHFILATEDGTVAGWQTGSSAVLRADESAGGAVYKGLAMVSAGGANELLLANFFAGTVDVFDATYVLHAPSGAFADPTLPAGLAPFNIAAIDDLVYVAYAKQDAAKHDDQQAPGNGAVNVFDTSGKLVRRLVTGGALNSPWALVRAPNGYGALAGALLVGNFGNGSVIAVDIDTGAVRATLADAKGTPLVIDGLWGLAFQPAAAGAVPALFFAAGPMGETHGALGRLELAP